MLESILILLIAALSFDTTMLAVLALQHYFHNIDGNTSLSNSLFAVANPPGIKVGPASWQTARSLILRGIDINYNGVSGPLGFLIVKEMLKDCIL